eukprot:1151685-Pelagomonas_calceolata.AAC.2
MLKTARIPSSWKAAKLAPMYKKGAVTHPSNYWMLAVSRNNLHWQPLFIFRHLKHAAQTLQPQSSPRLYATLIDFKQGYDLIPRVRLLEHLQNCQMPS